MSSKDRRIENEAAYEKTLAWLVEKAKLLDDPLTLSPAEREKLTQSYDFAEQRVQEYRRGQSVIRNPQLKKIYDDAGIPYQEPPKEAKADDRSGRG